MKATIRGVDLLDDLVTNNFGVKFFMPFDEFHLPSVPEMSEPTGSTAVTRSTSSKPGTTGLKQLDA